MAWAMSWPWLWVALWLPFPFIDQPAVLAALKPVALVVRDHWHAQPLLWTLLVLLAMAVALVHVFGQGDAGHARAYASCENFRKITSAGATGQKPPLAAYGRWGEVITTPFRTACGAWLARAVRLANPQRRSVMARLAVVLHGPQHWVLQVGVLVAAQLAVVAGLPLWASRREQAVLMLLPGVPQGAALNRALARQQIAHLLITVSVTLPALLALAWWGQTLQVCAIYSAVLPVTALVWRDASRMREPSPALAFVPYLIVMVLGVTSMLLLRWQPGWLWPWALGMVLLAATLLRWRWRRVSQWPQALPAGRLA